MAEGWRLFQPEQTTVIVVEEGDQIIGCWALFRVVHAEGIWIAPAYRNRGVVARRLLRALTATAQQMGARAVLTAALTQQVADLARRIGASLLPGEHFVLPIAVPSPEEVPVCPLV